MVQGATSLFRAVSDPIRLRILRLLQDGELCVGDLVTVLNVPQPTASRHLTYLRGAGLISARKNSYWTFYSLAKPRTKLHRKLMECVAAAGDHDANDQKRLAAVRRNGGCCPI